MPNALVRLPEFQAPDTRINFAPISNALTDWRKAQEFNSRHALDQERLGMERERQGMAKRQAETQESDNEVKQIAGVAQLIDQMKADDPQRAGAWGKLVASRPTFGPALQKYGIDPTDHINGPKFLVAQARGPVDQGVQEERDARIGHTRQLTAESEARTGAAGDNAASRRMEVYAKVVQRMGDNPTREVWAQESAPGGMLHVAFGGKPPAFERAPYILAQARQDISAQFEPTEQDRIAGITRDDKIRAFRQQRIHELHGVDGKKLIEKGERLRADGTIEPLPGGKISEGDKQRQIMHRAATDNLNKAEDVLTSGNMFTNAWGEKTGIGETGQAYSDYEGAVLQMVYALSGKQTTNKEMERFLTMYKPTYGDSESRIKDKTARIRGFMNSALSAVRAGKNWDDIEGELLQRYSDGKGPKVERAPAKNDGGPLPAGDYRYNPATGKVEAVR